VPRHLRSLPRSMPTGNCRLPTPRPDMPRELNATKCVVGPPDSPRPPGHTAKAQIRMVTGPVRFVGEYCSSLEAAECQIGRCVGLFTLRPGSVAVTSINSLAREVVWVSHALRRVGRSHEIPAARPTRTPTATRPPRPSRSGPERSACPVSLRSVGSGGPPCRARRLPSAGLGAGSFRGTCSARAPDGAGRLPDTLASHPAGRGWRLLVGPVPLSGGCDRGGMT